MGISLVSVYLENSSKDAEIRTFRNSWKKCPPLHIFTPTFPFPHIFRLLEAEKAHDKYSDLKRHSFVSNTDYQIISFCPMSMSIFLFLFTQYWGNYDCCVVSVVWRLPPSLSLPGVVVSLMVRVQHKKQTITSCYNSQHLTGCLCFTISEDQRGMEQRCIAST